jgi:hypothetical protein
MDGVERVHYPDLLVETTEAKELWEVKLRSEALNPAVLARASCLSCILPRWGYGYRTMLGEDLARQPRLNNASLLLSLGTRAINDCEREDVRRAMGDRGRLVWSEACRGDYGPKGRENLCGLVLRGELTINMNSPVLPTTQFVARKGGL